MVAVVQLVRASDCGSECRGFESHLPPQEVMYLKKQIVASFLLSIQFVSKSNHGGRSSVG